MEEGIGQEANLKGRFGLDRFFVCLFNFRLEFVSARIPVGVYSEDLLPLLRYHKLLLFPPKPALALLPFQFQSLLVLRGPQSINLFLIINLLKYRSTDNLKFM